MTMSSAPLSGSCEFDEYQAMKRAAAGLGALSDYEFSVLVREKERRWGEYARWRHVVSVETNLRLLKALNVLSEVARNPVVVMNPQTP